MTPNMIQRANTRNAKQLVANLADTTDIQVAGFLKEGDLITGIVIRLIPPIKLENVKRVSDL